MFQPRYICIAILGHGNNVNVVPSMCSDGFEDILEESPHCYKFISKGSKVIAEAKKQCSNDAELVTFESKSLLESMIEISRRKKFDTVWVGYERKHGEVL